MIEILRKRRSVRQFLDKEIEKEKIDILKEAVLRSPSSRGINPWEFIFVTDKELLEKLSKAKKHGSAFLKNAKLGVLVIADTRKSDVCIEDCSIAAITLQYVAESLGLGSCWAQIRLREHNDNISAEEYVRNLFVLPDYYLIECIIGIGYPKNKPQGHDYSTLQFEKIHTNGFKND
ncbi:nitroreductase [Deferribacter desulfuricans SSM1]|uniref:Nitroreductase n=1 Tax=Deferribacter desulfuricans (strain DSM 14783 / JCM 11476 / NBRC 101012 / SSM1) TaxID=639282 RepID=D3PDT9_DEFDS|nr:nitroreductase family protein [Deferribacter desulfuricans]BAI80762.1 nitroreductase [Deferribacter desulfuricans SSM1]